MTPDTDKDRIKAAADIVAIIQAEGVALKQLRIPFDGEIIAVRSTILYWRYIR